MNYRGLYTLYIKEVNRFLNVYNQTLIAPLINTLLLLSIFSIIFKGRVDSVEGIPFKQFIIPGLIMMTLIQNAFANTSSTLTFAKVLGIIVDMLIPPFSAKELTLALSLGGATRGICSGGVVIVAVLGLGYLYDPQLIFHVHHWGAFFFYLFFSAMAMSLLGMIAGILADTFDQMSALTNFIITPLSFLSGTFYSVNSLPVLLQHISHANPFFYMIDGFRYALTGHSDFSIAVGVGYILTLNVVLYGIVYTMIKKGYRIKS